MYSNLPTRRLAGTLQRNPALGYLGCGCELGLQGLGDPISMALSFNPITAGISAGVGLATTALGSWLSDKRATGQQKIASTSVVNDLEPLLRANANAYAAGPGTCQDQAAALAAFDSAMQWLQSSQGCGNIQLGAPGQACINDRMPGGKWDWYAMYRNPIANDTRPVCNTTADSAEQSAVQNIINAISGSSIQTNPQGYSTAPPTGTTTVAASGITSTVSSAVAGSGVSSALLFGGIGLVVFVVLYSELS